MPVFTQSRLVQLTLMKGSPVPRRPWSLAERGSGLRRRWKALPQSIFRLMTGFVSDQGSSARNGTFEFKLKAAEMTLLPALKAKAPNDLREYLFTDFTGLDSSAIQKMVCCGIRNRSSDFVVDGIEATTR